MVVWSLNMMIIYSKLGGDVRFVWYNINYRNFKEVGMLE